MNDVSNPRHDNPFYRQTFISNRIVEDLYTLHDKKKEKRVYVTGRDQTAEENTI